MIQLGERAGLIDEKVDRTRIIEDSYCQWNVKASFQWDVTPIALLEEQGSQEDISPWTAPSLRTQRSDFPLQESEDYENAGYGDDAGCVFPFPIDFPTFSPSHIETSRYPAFGQYSGDSDAPYLRSISPSGNACEAGITLPGHHAHPPFRHRSGTALGSQSPTTTRDDSSDIFEPFYKTLNVDRTCSVPSSQPPKAPESETSREGPEVDFTEAGQAANPLQSLPPWLEEGRRDSPWKRWVAEPKGVLRCSYCHSLGLEWYCFRRNDGMTACRICWMEQQRRSGIKDYSARYLLV